jgi:integrase
MALNDYTVLAEQPLSAHEFAGPERAAIIISAVIDDKGRRHTLSHYGDQVWELWPFFYQSNLSKGKKRIDWSKVPTAFREPVKAAIYRYWMIGTPGSTRPEAATVINAVKDLKPFLRYLESSAVASLRDIHALHISNYVHEQKVIRKRRAAGLRSSCLAIELLYRFKDQHPESLTFHPWPESSAWEIAGSSWKYDKSTGKTPLIPSSVLARLFPYAESILWRADALLDERDSGRRSQFRDSEVLVIRDACFFLLGILTGMRCEELVGVEIGAGRTEVIDGVTYHWVSSVEHKTKKGRVEYLMPAMCLDVLRVMERWSAPYRAALQGDVADLQRQSGGETLERLRRLASGRESSRRLFLSMHREINALSGSHAVKLMHEFAKRAGVDWKLSPHQLRRTYAWTFVRHRLGNLLFLKEQFKHSSIEMSQLYAANPKQDPALYDEILSEVRDFKIALVQNWLSGDQPLAGGAGKRIAVMRAHDFPNRAALIQDTAERVSIRSTGHAWCLAQDDGCGGAGLYEKTRCASCSSGVIDQAFRPVWRAIYDHQRELLANAGDLGPGAQQRVHNDLGKARAVLSDLGIELESEEADGRGQEAG